MACRCFEESKTKKVECKFIRSGYLLLIWHDKCSVSMLSTVHDASVVNSGKVDFEQG